MPEMEIERRCLPASELRLDASGDAPKITGYAARFNTWTDIGGMFREMVLPGAFKKTIKEADIRALWNHDPNYVLGRNKAGTLSLAEDDKGLQVDIKPLDATWARDLMESMKRGDVNQMSFGFQAVQTVDDFNEDTRQLKEVRLFDVSVVTYPAYPTTTAQVRSAFQKVQEERSEFDEIWKSITDKLKSGEEMTEEERQVFIDHLPPNISGPAESHLEPEKGPEEIHPETAWMMERSLLTQTIMSFGGILK